MNTPASSRRRRLSLRMLFGILTLAALAIALSMTRIELQREREGRQRDRLKARADLQREEREAEGRLQQLRCASGWPMIHDPQRVSVGGTEFEGLAIYRFRLYKPAGRKLQLCYSLKATEQPRLADGIFPLQMPSTSEGEATEGHIDIALRRQDGQMLLHINGLSVQVRQAIPKAHYLNFHGREPTDCLNCDIWREAPLVPPNDLPYRLLKIAEATGATDEGLLVWLEEARRE